MADDITYGYTDPVAQLLTYGRPGVVEPGDWPNYLELGFTIENVPELVRLATDERWVDDNDVENLASWAPVHAWRALGQLHALSAAEPLLLVLKNQSQSEWVLDEVPEVYGMMGPAAYPVLAAFMSDHTTKEWSRIIASAAIERIGLTSPDTRSISVEILSKQLETFGEGEYELNAFIIESLIKLKAKEAAPVIERAFAADVVDDSIIGKWEDVQEALGLLSPAEVEDLHRRRADKQRAQEEAFDRVMKSDVFLRTEATPSNTYWRTTPRPVPNKKAKAKSKMSKQSRKKNRKR